LHKGFVALFLLPEKRVESLVDRWVRLFHFPLPEKILVNVAKCSSQATRVRPHGRIDDPWDQLDNILIIMLEWKPAKHYGMPGRPPGSANAPRPQGQG